MAALQETFPIGGYMRGRGLKVLLYGALILYSLGTLYPLFLMVMSSFKSTTEIFDNPFSLPAAPSLDAYERAWSIGHLSDYFLNSVIVTMASVAIILVVGSLAAYPIGRYDFKGRNVLYVYFLSGLMLPIKLGIVPIFFLMKTLGLYDTRLSLILIYAASGMPFTIFVLSGFFRTLPKDLEDAARIDGANEWHIYWRIMLPLIRPALATVAIFNFIPLWNDFFFPLILIQTDELKTIPAGIVSFFGTYQTDWAMIFAGLTIGSVPLILLFLFASKHIIKGLTAGAVKG
ncbi:MAG: carbohydrate ABC transporter permease [Actinomycetota bacterium]